MECPGLVDPYNPIPVPATIGLMARGYAEGPATEDRLDALDRGEVEEIVRPPERPAVYGSTSDDPDQHFIGWLDDVDPDALFDAGEAWGLKVVRLRAEQP